MNMNYETKDQTLSEEQSMGLRYIPLHRLRSPWNAMNSPSSRSLSIISSNNDLDVPFDPVKGITDNMSGTESNSHVDVQYTEPIPRPFLSFSPLRKISEQCEKFGSISKLSVSGGLIAIGFDTGLTAVFDLVQRIRCTCASEDAYGDVRHKVTALDISHDASFLAVGHASGNIFLYDIFDPKEPARYVPPIDKQVLATGLGEGHLPDVPILHIHFVSTRKTGFISADANGLCFYHSLGRMLGMASNDTLRVYGQYQGSPPIISALTLPVGNAKHASDAHNFVALLLQDKMLLIGLQPSAKTWYRCFANKPGETAAMAWFPTTLIDERIFHPMLAFAFGKELRVLHVRSVRVKNNQTLSSLPSAIMLSEETLASAPDPIEGLHWVHRSLLLVETQRTWTLYDFRKHCYTEWQPHDPVLYAKDESVSPEQHLSIWRSKAFTFANDQVYTGDFVPWDMRLRELEQANEYISAIQLGLSLYDGANLGSGIGLPDSSTQQKATIADAIQCLFNKASSQRPLQSNAAAELIHLCAQFAIATQQFDYLFGEFYTLYENDGLETLFVQEMEDFILSGRIRTPPPSLMQQLLTSSDNAQDYVKMEQLILHVNPVHLDIDQAMALCLEHDLWDGLAYICEEVLQDYVTPVARILYHLHLTQNMSYEEKASTHWPGASESHDYTIFRIISARYQGLKYPSMEPLSTQEAILAVRSLNTLLFSERPLSLPDQTDKQSWTDVFYPYLRTIMMFDAEAFLDVLDLSFEHDFFGDDQDADQLSRRAILNILYRVCMVDDLPYSSVLFTALFAARNSAKYPQFVSVTDSEADWLFKTFTHGGVYHSDCEFALECLLSVHPITYTHEHLDMLERSHFWNVYENALKKTQRYEDLLQYYMLDRDGEHHTPGQLYERVTDLFNLPALQQHDGWKRLENVFLESVPTVPESLLSDVTRIVISYFPSCDISVLEKLSDTHRQYLYLQPFFAIDHGFDKAPPTILRTKWIDLVAEYCPTLLLCQLESHPITFFDLNQVCKVSEKHGFGDILIWAYDRLGQTDQAMDMLDTYVHDTATRVHTCIEIDTESAGTATGELNFNQCRQAFQSLSTVFKMACRIGMEHSTQDQINVDEVREHWFRILNAAIALEHRFTTDLSSASNQLLAFASSQCQKLMGEVLAALVTSVPFELISFPLLFKRLIGEHSQSPRRSFYEMRKVINAMLMAYRLRCDLLDHTSRLCMADAKRLFHELVRERSIGWLVYESPLSCERCAKSLEYRNDDGEDTNLILTPQGRLFHHECFSNPGP